MQIGNPRPTWTSTRIATEDGQRGEKGRGGTWWAKSPKTNKSTSRTFFKVRAHKQKYFSLFVCHRKVDKHFLISLREPK